MTGTRGELAETGGAGTMSVAEAKARLRAWGAEADEAQRLALEAARLRARKAAPYAALGAGVLGLLSAAGFLRRSKRSGRDREDRRSALGGIEGVLPLIMAGARLAPTVMGMMERMRARGSRRRRDEDADEA